MTHQLHHSDQQQQQQQQQQQSVSLWNTLSTSYHDSASSKWEQLTVVCAFTVAPRSSSNRTTSKWPAPAAKCSGVHPPWVRRFHRVSIDPFAQL